MRNCDVCGTEVPEASYVCPRCKNTFSHDENGVEVLIKGSQWGKIHVDLGLDRANANVILGIVKRV